MPRTALPLASCSVCSPVPTARGSPARRRPARFTKLVRRLLRRGVRLRAHGRRADGLPRSTTRSSRTSAPSGWRCTCRSSRPSSTWRWRLWTERVALPYDDLIDLEALESRIRGDLLEWQKIGFRMQNPMTYSRIPGEGMDVLLKRDFAPAADRLKSVTARLRAVPAVYAAGKANVKTPPKEWTDLALQMSNGSLGYFQDTVTAWAKEAAGADSLALADFNRANTTAVRGDAGLDPLPAEGAEAAEHRELGDRPGVLRPEDPDRGDELRAAASRSWRRARPSSRRTARRRCRPRGSSTPGGRRCRSWRRCRSTTPRRATCIPAVRRSLEGVRQFVVSKNLVTFPSEVRSKG